MTDLNINPVADSKRRKAAFHICNTLHSEAFFLDSESFGIMKIAKMVEMLQ